MASTNEDHLSRMLHKNVNGTWVVMSDNLTELIAAMLAEQGGRPAVPIDDDSGTSEMVYVVVVLIFYALAIMMLIGSQVGLNSFYKNSGTFNCGIYYRYQPTFHAWTIHKSQSHRPFSRFRAYPFGQISIPLIC